MAVEVQELTLGDIARADYGLVDGPFGSNLPASTYTTQGVPVIRGSNLSLGTTRFRDDEFVFVSDETAQRLSRSLCGPNDIVFTKKGTIGQTGLIPAAHRFDRFLLSSNQMKLSVDEEKADPLFVYYFVSSPQSQRKIVQDASVTGVPKTNLAYLRDFPIRLPSLPQQRAIACILGTLDDKIELNRKVNQTLEEMARAIFKSWFVDFDPVRAKAEGRKPHGMDAATAALFPDGFQESELGKIPRGWTPSRVGELSDCIKGRSYKSSELQDSDTALVSLKSFLRGGGYRSDGLKPFTGTYKPEQLVEPGEMVVAYTDVTQAADVIGRPAIVRPSSRYSKLVASLDMAIVRPTALSVSVPFFYCLFLTDAFRTHTYAHTTGTTVLHLAKDAVPSYVFPLADSRIVGRFTSAASAMLSRVTANEQESETLASLRDALLPKLLSGDLRIKDSEKLVEASL